MNTYFITGIGTDVGKTVVAAIVTEAMKADYWKPVQAGELDHTDTDKVRELISNERSRMHRSSYALQTPMSPHAAAAIEDIRIQSEMIKKPVTQNHLVIEGAGGLLVPLNNTLTILDLIRDDYKVIVVSRHYLGSINHTLLTLSELKRRGLQIAGVIFNGRAHPGTEDVIKKMGAVRDLGRIEEEEFIDKHVIKMYADQFKPRLENIS